MAGIIATAEIDIDAPLDRVWSALTDAQQIQTYMFGSRVETDWSIGSPIVWKGEYQGRGYEDKGEVLVFDEPRQLSVTHFSPLGGGEDRPENYHTLVYTLTETDTKVHLILTQDGNSSEEDAEHATANWQEMLKGLKGHVEGR